MSSTIFLDEHFLHGNGGDGIILDNSGVISTIQVGSNIQNPMLTLSNYDKASPNLLLNPEFDTGTTSDWVTSGSVIVQTGTFPGEIYETVVNNLSSISQQVDLVFENKHPIFEFWHRGEAIILSLETRDIGDSYIDGINRIIPESEDWINYSIPMRNYFPETAISAKITLSSVWDNSIIAKCNMMASDYCSSVNIGDEFDADSTDVVRVSGKKLMVGNGLAGINNSILDIRGNSYFLGDLTVTGTITSGPIFGSIGTQKWVSSIIFTSGSQTQINYTSGNIQLVSGQIFGINAGDSGTLSQTTFLYLDSDVSITTLQTTTDYSLCIGANKIFIGTCYPGTSGYASFVSQSNNLPLINATDLITPFSITNGNLAINSVTASNISVTNLQAISANMGALSVDNLLTMSGVSSAITIGTTPPTSSVLGTGIWLDRTGVYSLNSNVQEAVLSNSGFTAGPVSLNSLGISLSLTTSYNSDYAIKWLNGGLSETTIRAYNDGSTAVSGFVIDTTSTGSNLSRDTYMNIDSLAKTGKISSIDIVASRQGGQYVNINLLSPGDSSQATILLNGATTDVDTIIYGSGTSTAVVYVDALNLRVGINTNTPSKSLDIVGTLGVSAGTLLSSTLLVSGASTFNNTTQFNGNMTFNGNPSGTIEGGTYTPTLTNTTNVAASTSAQCNYMRIGNQVTVSGRISIDPTAAVATLLEISLPIVSNIGSNTDIGGCANSGTVASMSAAIDGNTTNDTANLSFIATDLSNRAWSFIFMYEVI